MEGIKYLELCENGSDVPTKRKPSQMTINKK